MNSCLFRNVEYWPRKILYVLVAMVYSNIQDQIANKVVIVVRITTTVRMWLQILVITIIWLLLIRRNILYAQVINIQEIHVSSLLTWSNKDQVMVTKFVKSEEVQCMVSIKFSYLFIFILYRWSLIPSYILRGKWFNEKL